MESFLIHVAGNSAVVVGYLIICALVALEAMPVAGMMAPGLTAAIVCGFLTYAGYFHPITAAVLLSISAFIGDVIGYLLGRRCRATRTHRRLVEGEALRHRIYRRFHALFQTHPFIALIIGKFGSVTRAFAPFLAGTASIHLSVFLMISFFSSILWSVVYLSIGYLLGAGHVVALRSFGDLMPVLYLIGAMVLIVVFGVRDLRQERNERRRYAEASVLALLVIVLLIALFTAVPSLREYERHIAVAVATLRTDMLTALMLFLTSVFGPEAIVIYTFIGAAVLVWLRKYRAAFILFVTIGSAAVASTILKYLVGRIRPEGGVITETGYSFPSGHTTMATAFFLLAAFALARSRASRPVRVVGVSVLLALIFLVGASRVYLGVHWISDVAAGFALGAASVLAVLIIAEHPVVIKRLRAIASVCKVNAHRAGTGTR